MPGDNQKTMRQVLLSLRCAVCALLLLLCLITEAGANLYTFRGEGETAYFTNVPGEGRKQVRVILNVAGYPPRTARQGKQHYFPAGGQAKKTDRTAPLNDPSYDPIIASASEQFAVDPDLVRAVIKAESNFNAHAVSPKGAQGLMQLMPPTAHELGVVDAFDPGENIYGGVKYLRRLLDVFREDHSLALAAYNAGPSRVMNRNQIPPVAETQEYVKRVLEYFRRLKY
jgi:soluble lytic murein transglycosylase-like protein